MPTPAVFAANAVRAELARKRKTQGDLADALEITPHTLGRRLNGEVPFDLIELAAAAAWLDVPLSTFIPADSERAVS